MPLLTRVLCCPRCMQSGGGIRSPLTQHSEGRGAMRKRILALLIAVMMVVMSAAPAMATPPQTCEKLVVVGEAQGSNCGASLEHRANPSGEGNFGQCHKAVFQSFISLRGQQASEFNPSPQNTGEADCRTVQGREGSGFVAGVVQCGSPGVSATAEGRTTVQNLTLHNYAHCPG